MQPDNPRYARLTRFLIAVFCILGFLLLMRAVAPSLTRFLVPAALVSICGFLLVSSLLRDSSVKGHVGDLDS